MEIQTKKRLRTITKKHLADTFTPVSIYLKVRDQYTESVLLESTDFRSVENCFPLYHCLEPQNAQAAQCQ